MQVVTMSAMGNGRSASGEILRPDGGFLVMVDGNVVGRAGSIEAAAERLAHELGRRVPGDPMTWSVTAACPTGGLNIQASRPPVGGGGGSLPRCARSVLGRRSLDSLREALAAFARVIGRCCR